MLKRESFRCINSDKKTIDIGAKLLHLMRKVYIRCFFTLKFSKKTYMSSVNFLISGFGIFFWFLGVWMSLLSCLGCFLSDLGQNRLRNQFFLLMLFFICIFSK
jgi:hypothetical protein